MSYESAANIEQMESYQCTFDGCNRSFLDPSSRRKHAAIHIGPKPYRCNHCMMAFPDSLSTSIHIKTYHDTSLAERTSHAGDGGKESFWCPFCSMAFSGISEVDVHISQSHTDLKHNSGLKGIPATSQGHEQMTVPQRSKQAPVLRCTYQRCNRLFAWPHHLQYHIRGHEGERLHKCEFPDCGKAFLTAQHRNVHMKFHTGEKSFICHVEHCQKTFTTAQHLKNHIRIHTGEKPFPCTHPDCDKTFREYSSLKKHLVIHTGEKPYKCSQCDRAFTQNSTLHTHIKRRHSQKSEVKGLPAAPKGDKIKPKASRKSRKKNPQAEKESTLTEPVMQAKDDLKLLLVQLISDDRESKKLESNAKSSSLMPGKDVLLLPRKEESLPISQLCEQTAIESKNVIVVSQPSESTVPSFYDQHDIYLEKECDVQTQDSDFHFYTDVVMESTIVQENRKVDDS